MEVIFAACSAAQCLTVQVSWVGGCVQVFLLLKICTRLRGVCSCGFLMPTDAWE